MEWFGSSSFSLVDKDSIKTLEEGIKGKPQSKKKASKKLEIAIKEALQALAEKQQSDIS